jgi:hypothetical protein
MRNSDSVGGTGGWALILPHPEDQAARSSEVAHEPADFDRLVIFTALVVHAHATDPGESSSLAPPGQTRGSGLRRSQ